MCHLLTHLWMWKLGNCIDKFCWGCMPSRTETCIIYKRVCEYRNSLYWSWSLSTTYSNSKATTQFLDKPAGIFGKQPFTPKQLEDVITNEFWTSNSAKINEKSNNDMESRLGVYLQLNPALTSPTQRSDLLEFERVLLTRYRCGSHNLMIEVGRLCNPKILREERLCKCNNGIQSLRHCLFECELLREVHEQYNYSTIEEAFNSSEIVALLVKIGKVLNV